MMDIDLTPKSSPELRRTIEAFKELDAQWIDIKSLRLWLETCDKEHGSRCQRVLTRESTIETLPQYLVDIQRKCLKLAKEDDRYAALSYVWGGATTTLTSTSNLALLREPGSLFSSQVTLPKTIKYTIGLLERLDIPYLWLDALCIVQDDNATKQRQIHAMAWIYANAYITIIAADGDSADHGLWGIRGVTDPRHLDDDTVSAIYTSLKNHSPGWYSRGWTFQELTFSRRRTMFHNQVALWECPCASWTECRLDSIFKILRWPVQLHYSMWPNMKNYLNAVKGYNTRQFTFPQDALGAVVGLHVVRGHAFDGGFITGLPQMFFHESLLWQPEDTLKRRVSTVGPSDSSPLPSWSWVGWEGAIDIQRWTMHLSHVRFFHPSADVYAYQVTPTVKWFYSNPGEDITPIHASSLKYRPQPGSDRSLPPGSQLANTKHTMYEFFGLEETRAAYPLPLLCPPGDIVSASLLHSETKRGFFQADRHEWPSSRGTLCDEVFLLDKEGERMGMLRLNSKSGSKIRIEQDLWFELVEIAGGEIQDPGWIST
ncbi:heterokaryon incompatibility protein-domain-containing protein [Hypoxylon trugodes]|uniref:heterokaryon incompatibility protein-domain-containing protein n=1 Tax=Hypoxylon trugodes TaxID=326681 RepID=UPI0021972C72|nr:heterokaryon incompatibility protein-domain-containing protein [Hypoxylon trugodes]KAI1385462.1 heterokaryon incompatibility protein-domain-containing protein [Hypoxylon trugodes]